MDYLISPSKETDWKIEDKQLINLLMSKWPNTQIKEIKNETRSYKLTWTIEFESLGTLEGGLQKDGQCIGLSGPLDACAIFALWFREQVLASQELWLYDQGFNCQISLTNETNADEIKSIFG